MRTTTLLLAILLSAVSVSAQIVVKGLVSDTKGEGLAGANVFIKGSYDGTAAIDDGSFSFKTSLLGKQTIVATFIGYANQEKEILLDTRTVEVKFTLKEETNRINDVVITAGTYETADRKRSVTLQPLDIVTTPSAAGDIYGALTALPGTATVGEDGRLFVRGGDGYETKTFIDGLLSKKPYSSNVPDLPSRGRFSPFMFSGTTFSTGGYSAEYGQALSSAVKWLKTNPHPHLAFLDIQLADGLSFEIFEQVNIEFPVIFTTAFNEYAIKAFKVNSIDYLLKPIDEAELQKAIGKFRKGFAPKPQALSSDAIAKALSMLTNTYKTRFVVKVGEHIRMIPIDEVALFFSSEKYTFIRTTSGRDYGIDQTLEQVALAVSPDLFFRVSRKHIIALSAIADIISYSGSRLKLKLTVKTDEDILVSREKVADFKGWLDR